MKWKESATGAQLGVIARHTIDSCCRCNACRFWWELLAVVKRRPQRFGMTKWCILAQTFDRTVTTVQYSCPDSLEYLRATRVAVLLWQYIGGACRLMRSRTCQQFQGKRHRLAIIRKTVICLAVNGCSEIAPPQCSTITTTTTPALEPISVP